MAAEDCVDSVESADAEKDVEIQFSLASATFLYLTTENSQPTESNL